MSQPKITSQKPNPDSTMPQNLSRLAYFPRNTPSMSKPPTLTFLMPRSLKRARSSLASMARDVPTFRRLRPEVLHLSAPFAGDDGPGQPARRPIVRREG